MHCDRVRDPIGQGSVQFLQILKICRKEDILCRNVLNHDEGWGGMGTEVCGHGTGVWGGVDGMGMGCEDVWENGEGVRWERRTHTLSIPAAWLSTRYVYPSSAFSTRTIPPPTWVCLGGSKTRVTLGAFIPDRVFESW